MSLFNVFCFVERVLVNDPTQCVYKQVFIALFVWHLVFGTKNQFLPSPENLAFSSYAVWSEQRRYVLPLLYAPQS